VKRNDIHVTSGVPKLIPNEKCTFILHVYGLHVEFNSLEIAGIISYES